MKALLMKLGIFGTVFNLILIFTIQGCGSKSNPSNPVINNPPAAAHRWVVEDISCNGVNIQKPFRVFFNEDFSSLEVVDITSPDMTFITSQKLTVSNRTHDTITFSSLDDPNPLDPNACSTIIL